MIKRRMISLDIIKSDNYQEMPMSSKYLYFELLVRADDVGIIDDAYAIMRLLGASSDDLKLLIAKGYLIVLDRGLYVVSDWAIHNDTVKRWFRNGDCTLHKDIFKKLHWIPNTRYDYQPDQPDLLMDSDVEIKRKIIEAKYEITKPSNLVEPTGDDVIKEMDQIIALLSAYGISQQSAKGRQIAEKYSLARVIAGIKYAQDNMPVNCNNIPGWIVNCIEMEHTPIKQCPKCHGRGKKQAVGLDSTRDDGGMRYYISDCPECKGTGFVK